MSTSLQDLLRRALLNNTYDSKVLDNTLHTAWTNSYSALYRMQRSLIRYDERMYTSNQNNNVDVTHIGNLYVNNLSQACFDVDCDLIHVGSREEFKRSKFYHKRFSCTDIVNHPKIFTSLPIIMIDGQCIWDYKISVHTGYFTVILPYGRDFVINKNRNDDDSLYYYNKTIQVLLVDNVMYTKLSLNKSQTLNIVDHTLSINLSLIKNKVPHKKGIYFLSIHIPNDNGGIRTHNTTLIPTRIVNNHLTCTLSNDDFAILAKYTKNFYVSIVFINHLTQHTFYTGSMGTICENGECNLFVLQQDECTPYNMPIPVENLIVIRYRNGASTYLPNYKNIELYYPNIYRIKDPDMIDGDRYSIFYFYKDVDDLKYHNLYDYYYKFLKIHFNNEPIEKIIDLIHRNKITYDGYTEAEITDFKNTFEHILNYESVEYKYGEIDYTRRYLNDPDNIGKTPFEYKDDIMRSWILNDADILNQYVLHQNRLYNPVFHLWTNTIDLRARLRTSTAPEIDPSRPLNSEYYVFAFRNANVTSSKCLNLRVYVDGIFINNLIQIRHHFTDYVYIPTSQVTNDSYIEIEIFPSYEYSTKMRFSSMDDVHDIKFPIPDDGIHPTADDIYFIEPSGDLYTSIPNGGIEITPSNGNNTVFGEPLKFSNDVPSHMEYEKTNIYNKSSFKISNVHGSDVFDIRTTKSEYPVQFTPLKHIRIQPAQNSVVDIDLVMSVSKSPKLVTILIEDPEAYPIIPITNHNFNYDERYIRVYKNGRFVKPSKYKLVIEDTGPAIVFLTSCHKGDVISVDITPYKYREVYKQETIREDINLIDLTGYIDKPFDIRYYDVYLNGRKLSLNNVFAITPWTIAIVNRKSIHNLRIYEKERDYEYFGTEFKSHKYYYTLNDLFHSSFITNDEITQIIDSIIDAKKDKNLNIYPNVNDEPVYDSDGSNADLAYIAQFYENELIPKRYTNPDILQFAQNSVTDHYPIISSRYLVDPDELYRNNDEFTRRHNYDNVYLLDPDIFIHGENDGTVTRTIYTIGHQNDVSNEIFDDNIDKIE